MKSNFTWVKNISWIRDGVMENLMSAEAQLRDGYSKPSAGTTKSCLENIICDFCKRTGIIKKPNYGLKNNLDLPAFQHMINSRTLIEGMHKVRIRGNIDSHDVGDVGFTEAEDSLRVVATLLYKMVSIVRDGVCLPSWNFEHYNLEREIKTVEIEKIVTVVDTEAIDRLTQELAASEHALAVQVQETNEQEIKYNEAIRQANHKTAVAIKTAGKTKQELRTTKLELESEKQRNIVAVAQAKKLEDEIEANKPKIFTVGNVTISI